MNSTESQKYYFCASHESILELLQRGIWHNMPMNLTLEPIDENSVTIVKADGREVNATDVKIEKYVRLTQFPRQYLERWQGNLASVFLVEVNPQVLKAKDNLTIKSISGGRTEYLKSTMVDRFFIVRVHVFSQEVLKKLRASTSGETCHAPVVASSDLFPSDVQNQLLTVDYNFDLTKPQSETPVIAPISIPQSANQLKICKGDLLKSKMQTHVNTVNCVGVMGKGIALSFKNTYPEMYKDYQGKCKKHEVILGKPYHYRVSASRHIVNFPTKDHWKQNSKIEDVEEGLRYLLSKYQEWGIQSIALPPLGCGNGGLDWEEVLPLMRRYLEQMTIPVEIYAPHEAGTFGTAIQSKRPFSAADDKNPVKSRKTSK